MYFELITFGHFSIDPAAVKSDRVAFANSMETQLLTNRNSIEFFWQLGIFLPLAAVDAFRFYFRNEEEIRRINYSIKSFY